MDFPVTVESQTAFDELVRERLGRETAKQTELQEKIDALTVERDDLKKNTGDQETAIETAKQEGKAEATSELTDKFRAQLRNAEVRALAAELHFNDPADALAHIGDLSDITVDDQFAVDAETIKTRLTEIAGKKDYLLQKSEDFSFEQDGGLGNKGKTPEFSGKTGTDLMAAAIDKATKTK